MLGGGREEREEKLPMGLLKRDIIFVSNGTSNRILASVMGKY